MISCRPIQLRPEAFWSGPVGDTPWKSKLNGEVSGKLQFAIRNLQQGTNDAITDTESYVSIRDGL